MSNFNIYCIEISIMVAGIIARRVQKYLLEP